MIGFRLVAHDEVRERAGTRSAFRPERIPPGPGHLPDRRRRDRPSNWPLVEQSRRRSAAYDVLTNGTDIIIDVNAA